MRENRFAAWFLLSVIFVSFGALLLLSSNTPFSQNLQNTVFQKAEPFLVYVQKPARYVQDKIEMLQSVQVQFEQMQRLEQENKQLQQWMHKAKMLEAQNEALRKNLNVEHKPEYRFITAQVVVDPEASFAHSILINSGKRAGLEKGQAVIVPNGLLGRVFDTADHHARIVLLNDVNSRLPVVIEDTGDRAILAGENKRDAVLEHISPYHSVRAGMRVITSGHGGAMPYGIEVGTVIVNEKTGALSVRLSADAHKENFVQVVDYGLDPVMSGGSFASDSFLNIQ